LTLNRTVPWNSSRAGETYAKLIPNCSELKIISSAGHSAQVENPEETAKSMMDFLAK
jgi:pimeloyl-ACP methyl ester carboxylesterase